MLSSLFAHYVSLQNAYCTNTIQIKTLRLIASKLFPTGEGNVTQVKNNMVCTHNSNYFSIFVKSLFAICNQVKKKNDVYIKS